MLMLVGEKILPTLCLLVITWNNKGYPVNWYKMRVCNKSDNPNDKFTANDLFSKKFDHNVICL